MEGQVSVSRAFRRWIGFVLGQLLQAAARMAAEHQAGVEKAAAVITSVFLHGTKNRRGAPPGRRATRGHAEAEPQKHSNRMTANPRTGSFAGPADRPAAPGPRVEGRADNDTGQVSASGTVSFHLPTAIPGVDWLNAVCGRAKVRRCTLAVRHRLSNGSALPRA